MASAQVLGGSETVPLEDAVFGAPFNGPLVHECVVAELAARRRGTHATRTRGMVSGGTSKPWRQKGTGRARAGSSRSPLWTGGGTVFGPSPRHYTVKVNRKARRAALRCALSVHAARGSLFVMDAGAFGAPSTKHAHALVSARLGGSLLVVLAGEAEAAAAKSFRNIAGVSVLPAGGTGVADIVGAATLVVSHDALGALSDLASRAVRGQRAAAAAPAPAASSGNPTVAASFGAPADPTVAASPAASGAPADRTVAASPAASGTPAPPHGEPAADAAPDGADDGEEPA